MISGKIYDEWMEQTQLQKLRQILQKVKPEGTVLDVGAGPGFLEQFVDAVATDVNLENLRKADGPKVLCSGDALPFRSLSFDWVFCVDTVHLLKNADELKRVGRNAVITLFCNEHNAEERLAELGRFGKGETFLVKSDKEWDAVLVLRRH